MSPRSLVFFVVLTAVCTLSTVVVVGFAAPPTSSSVHSSGYGAVATTLRYAVETNYHDQQYYRSHPGDVRIRPEEMKVVDVPVEGNSQTVFVPMHEMEDAINKAQESHQQDCADLQNVIDEQHKELQRLKDRQQMSRMNHGAECKWGENHDEKMKRATDRVHYLTAENERLQVELSGERERFEFEKDQLERKLQQARGETLEAQRELSLERTYFETATKLLEIGLAREAKNARALEEQLMQRDEEEYHGDHRHHTFHEDLSPFETWEGPGAYEQQQGHRHQYPQDFHHHSQQDEEEFEEFEPQVRPHDYHQNSQVHSHHEPSYQIYEPEHFHSTHDTQTTQQYSHSRTNPNTNTRRHPTVTTTVMGASSIRDNLGINNIRDPMFR